MKYILSLQVNGNTHDSRAFPMNQSLDIKNINKLNVLSDTKKFTNKNNTQFFNQNYNINNINNNNNNLYQQNENNICLNNNISKKIIIAFIKYNK